jgi:DNA-binding CsgD family transcriptional regulator
MTTQTSLSPRPTIRPKAAPASLRVTRINEVLELLVAGLRDAYQLREREQAVARSLLFGRNSDAIAERLGIAERSVVQDIQDLFAKTNTDSRESLMRLALRIAGAREHADAPIRRGPTPAQTPGPDPLVACPTTPRSRHAGAWPAAKHD